MSLCGQSRTAPVARPLLTSSELSGRALVGVHRAGWIGGVRRIGFYENDHDRSRCTLSCGGGGGAAGRSRSALKDLISLSAFKS